MFSYNNNMEHDTGSVMRIQSELYGNRKQTMPAHFRPN